jgi:hypothetical protein
VPAGGGGCGAVRADVEATSVSLLDEAECVFRTARRIERVAGVDDGGAEPLLEYQVLPHWLSTTQKTKEP